MSESSENEINQRVSSGAEQFFYEAQLKSFSQDDALNVAIKNSIFEESSIELSDNRTFSFTSDEKNGEEENDELSKPDPRVVSIEKSRKDAGRCD